MTTIIVGYAPRGYCKTTLFAILPDGRALEIGGLHWDDGAKLYRAANAPKAITATVLKCTGVSGGNSERWDVELSHSDKISIRDHE